MIYHIIVNPIAGRKKKKTSLNFFQEYILKNDLHGKIYFSKDEGDPKKLASSIEKNNPNGGVIVVCGGDGTLNEVINGINDLSKWTFGILPLGSGNDYASKLNIPTKNLKDAFDVILNSIPKQLDYLMVNDMRCLNIAGTGVDIDILLRFEKYKKLHGSFRYLVATLVSLFKYKGVNYKVILDDKKIIEGQPFITAVCNGSQFGGGIKICTPACIDDSKLDFIFIKNLNKFKIPFLLPRLLKGTIHKCNENIYQHYLCEKVVVETEDETDFCIEIDGFIVKGNKFTFNIVKKGIKFFC